MNKKRSRIFLFVLLVVFAGLQAGCGPGKSAALEDGLRMTGRMMEKFTDFDGVESCRITAGWGEGLHVEYTIEVERGELELKVTGPAGRVVWQGVFREDERGNLDLPMLRGGDYHLSVSGRDAGGGVALVWKVE